MAKVALTGGLRADRILPEGFRARLSLGVLQWAGGRVLVGGSPWKVSILAPPVQDLVLRLRASGAAGKPIRTARDRAALRVLLDRGFAEKAPEPRLFDMTQVDIVIPVYNDPQRLADVLKTLPTTRVLVVDDGSVDVATTRDVAATAGAKIVHHASNRGPAAARNTGLRSTSAPFVAFIDADCLATPPWPANLLSHFDDPAVAAVAPRISPILDGQSLLERYEESNSSLDMGAQPELVRAGARLGFVPSAAIVVRRSAIETDGFDEAMHVGEDVDLVWRLAEAGWLVRYDPSVTVGHRTRDRYPTWLRRKVDYGSSAPTLERRHPGSLVPLRLSGWNAATSTLIAAGHPLLGAAVQVVPLVTLNRAFRSIPKGSLLAGRVAAQGLASDAVAVGHLLRREWWPLGALALAASPWSRVARAGALTMVTPLLLEWTHKRPAVNPAAYVALRLLDDAAYGTGVIASSVRARTSATLTPAISWGSSWRRRSSSSER